MLTTAEAPPAAPEEPQLTDRELQTADYSPRRDRALLIMLLSTPVHPWFITRPSAVDGSAYGTE